METGREEAVRTRNLMREVNERAAQAFDLAHDDEIDLTCECGEVSCFETVTLTRSTYEEILGSGAFVLAPGHTAPEGEVAGVDVSSNPVGQAPTRVANQAPRP